MLTKKLLIGTAMVAISSFAHFAKADIISCKGTDGFNNFEVYDSTAADGDGSYGSSLVSLSLQSGTVTENNGLLMIDKLNDKDKLDVLIDDEDQKLIVGESFMGRIELAFYPKTLTATLTHKKGDKVLIDKKELKCEDLTPSGSTPTTLPAPAPVKITDGVVFECESFAQPRYRIDLKSGKMGVLSLSIPREIKIPDTIKQVVINDKTDEILVSSEYQKYALRHGGRTEHPESVVLLVDLVNKYRTPISCVVTESIPNQQH